jgi:hypothetical protein
MQLQNSSKQIQLFNQEYEMNFRNNNCIKNTQEHQSTSQSNYDATSGVVSLNAQYVTSLAKIMAVFKYLAEGKYKIDCFNHNHTTNPR